MAKKPEFYPMFSDAVEELGRLVENRGHVEFYKRYAEFVEFFHKHFYDFDECDVEEARAVMQYFEVQNERIMGRMEAKLRFCR